jgi:hypothetical protein
MTTVREEAWAPAEEAATLGPDAASDAPPVSHPRPAAVQVRVCPGHHAVRDHQRHLVREQFLVVAVLLACLAATLGLLALQWLDAGPATGTSSPPPIAISTGGNT